MYTFNCSPNSLVALREGLGIFGVGAGGVGSKKAVESLYFVSTLCISAYVNNLCVDPSVSWNERIFVCGRDTESDLGFIWPSAKSQESNRNIYLEDCA